MIPIIDQHIKSGKYYIFITEAINESTLEKMIVYQETKGDRKTWVRPKI